MQIIDLLAYLLAALGLCAALAAASDPRLAEWLAAVLIARAEAVKAGRHVYKLARGCEISLELREAVLDQRLLKTFPSESALHTFGR